MTHRRWAVRRSRLLAILLAAAASACADPGAAPTHDHAGRPYPPECQRDLSHVNVPIIETTEASLFALAAIGGKHLNPAGRFYGLHIRRATGSTIYIDERLRGWLRADVIHHEKCHEVAGHWHG
jgi:hypothetical protein